MKETERGVPAGETPLEAIRRNVAVIQATLGMTITGDQIRDRLTDIIHAGEELDAAAVRASLALSDELDRTGWRDY